MEIEYPKIAIGRAKNLTNQKFGHWTVLYRTNNNNCGKTMWVCQCDCEEHTIKPVQAAHLLSQNSTNCGCQRKEMLRNLAIQRDKAIRIRNEEGKVIKKRCSLCHQWLNLDSFNLDITVKDGHSCICKQCNSNYSKRMYQSYKRGAIRRKYVFELTQSDFEKLIECPCYYCGEKPKQYNGIDRFDSQQGYILGNCVPCCEQCNFMKRNLKIEDWYNKMKKILNKWEGKENDLFRNT